MPTYSYKCSECGNEFELFQYMTDEPIKTCPTCHGKVERLIGKGAGVLFKGNGFYITDYRSESYKNGVKAEKSEKSEKTEKSTTDSSKSGSSTTDSSEKVASKK